MTHRLTEVLGDAVALHFDDHDDTNVHPDFLGWFADGADYDRFQMPVFSSQLEDLKAGRSVRYPVGDATIGPVKYVVADAPLGRAHSESGRCIDFMVFIDTPLDVAMARRILRNIKRETNRGPDDSVKYVMDEMKSYLNEARPIYEEFQNQIRRGCDVTVDGNLGIDEIIRTKID